MMRENSLTTDHLEKLRLGFDLKDPEEGELYVAEAAELFDEAKALFRPDPSMQKRPHSIPEEFWEKLPMALQELLGYKSLTQMLQVIRQKTE